MHNNSISDSEDEVSPPTVTVAMEFVPSESTFNFYIKRVSNCPYLVSYQKKTSRAVMYVVKGVHRRTWMGRLRNISQQEIETHNHEVFRTLSVDRHTMTIFNEFFSCDLSREEFQKTLLRIQFCDVDKYDNEVVIAEFDYWINSHPIERFREFDFPLLILKPDLGELELEMTFLPTSQRLCIEKCIATNLRLENDNSEVYYRALLYTDGRLMELHKSEKRQENIDSEDEIVFSRRFVFDLHRTDIFYSILVIQVIELVDGKKKVIGQFGLSDNDEQCENTLWKKFLDHPREKVSEIMRLNVGC